ncbi:hypothetical protein CHUAL_010938 [Chamberlinius hualienensis]
MRKWENLLFCTIWIPVTFFGLCWLPVFTSSTLTVSQVESSLLAFNCTSPNCTEINECSTNPCQNGATCEDQIGQFKCICPVGYSGETCTENIDECVNQPCLNGGTCVDGIGSYTCVCPVGLLGPNCSRDIDECLSMPCLHGGQCEDKIGRYVCHCVTGWSGSNCEFDVDECEPTPCQQGGRCEDKIGDYECHCVRPWSGKNCDINLDPCSNGGSCLNNATCVNLTEGNFTCQCKTGFSGQFCEVDNNECELEPCTNGGTCVDRPGNFSCLCPPMYGGQICADLYDDCISNPCHNGGLCHSNPPFRNSTCICPDGFAGDRCEFDIDECDGIVCPLNQVCVDLINNYRCECPAGFEGTECDVNVDDCADRPCRNGGSCVDGAGNFSCRCRHGFTGHRCELDLDECTVNRTSPCHRGICVNQPGSFQCYCSQGYTGPLCDHEYDECLSRPCKNGAICRDLVANYKCLCPIGYSGRNCETEIDECAVSPCLNNATCTDKIGFFNCSCLPGFTGILCEEDIDECLSSPCLHGGKCLDKVNGFLCDCEDTGFTGDFCQENIDDCLSNPCVQDSNCTDQIKNYTCSCHYGFAGKNCQLDVAECEERPCVNGGTCIEKSNRTIYELPDFHRPSGFPLGFYEYSTAGGYLCLCPRGFTGDNCEINIDDCVGNLCRSGVCVDGVDAYHCRCHQGFEGRHCEIEIDECRRHRPCSPGSSCIDLIGDYRCNCPEGIGGKNCTVPLTGCEQNDCLNGATCIPYLIGEDNHMRNCSCATGFYGPLCEHSTAVSFDGTQKVTIMGNASREYSLSFRFRTTLPDGLLVFGYGQTRYFLIYLQNSQVHAYVENVESDRIITKRKVNDGSWWTVRLLVLEAGLQLRLTNDNASEEVVVNRTIGFRPTFTGTVMGGVDSWMGSLSAHFQLQGFIGCMEDLILSGELIVPGSEIKKTSTEVTVLSNVTPNCIRTEQCFLTTCNRGGICVDLWNSYRCDCVRPHYGVHCEKEYESVTFGHENTSYSRVEVGIPRNVRQVLMNDTTVSLFLRTRKADGLIFYLGNGNSLDGASDGDTFLAAELESGLLRVSVKINGTPESLIDKLGQRLDDSYYHFLSVSLIDRTLSASINDTTLFRMGVEANRDKHLVATKLYLGGLPPTPSRRHRRQTSLGGFQNPLANISSVVEMTPTLPIAPIQEVAYFKGVLQDVRVNNWLVEMFNHSADSSMKSLRDNVTVIDVLPGVQSDNACHPNPCGNGSNCTVTWNDYVCHCAEGFRGKNCTDKEFCAFFSCPEGSECRSLIDGYECISNATFNGINSSVILVPHISSVSNDSIPSTFSFYFRSQVGGSIMHLSNGVDAYLDISMPNASIFLLSWGNSRTEQGEEYEIIFPTVADGNWHFLSLTFRDGFTFVELDDNGKTSRLPSAPAWNLKQILNQNGTSVVVGQRFRGCLRELRLGSIHLPFLPRISLLNDTSSNYFEAVNLDHIELNICQLCYDQECSRQSVCFDKFNNYYCNCSEGFAGQFCEVDIDECEDITCANGGTCVDGVAKFSCHCQPGYEGARCEFDIDECSSYPCQNGGTCTDMIAAYSCVCSSNYTGVNCEKEKAFDCSAHPCHSGATCLNVTAERPGDVAYRCVCPIGLTGVICDTEIDFCLPGPCSNGATCVNRPQFGMFECICPKNYEGPKCDQRVNHCQSAPCHNRGTCHPTDELFTCTCSPTFKGNQCEEDVDECENGTICQYGGTCMNLKPNYECKCVEERFGSNCQYYNVCVLDNPCVHGVCKAAENENTSYIPTCICDDGYEGKFCNDESQSLDAQTLGIVVGSVIAATILIIIVALAVFLTMAKKKRATRGTYSPSRQEMFGSRVEMGNVMKPPPEERLI